MDKRLYAGYLFDAYGSLLTEKQKLIFAMYYLEDFSLQEIGEVTAISRQAVRDAVKRSEQVLMHYEENLHLVERQIGLKAIVNDITEMAKGLPKAEYQPLLDKINKLSDIVENS